MAGARVPRPAHGSGRSRWASAPLRKIAAHRCPEICCCPRGKKGTRNQSAGQSRGSINGYIRATRPNHAAGTMTPAIRTSIRRSAPCRYSRLLPAPIWYATGYSEVKPLWESEWIMRPSRSRIAISNPGRFTSPAPSGVGSPSELAIGDFRYAAVSLAWHVAQTCASGPAKSSGAAAIQKIGKNDRPGFMKLHQHYKEKGKPEACRTASLRLARK